MILRWGDERALDEHALDDTSLPRESRGPITLHSGFDERWQLLDAPERFAEWAALVVGRFPDTRDWVTTDEPNGWAVERYAGGWRWLETRSLLRALDHQLAAHVLAADVLRRATSSSATVELPLVTHDPYELSRLLDDILVARDQGIDRGEIGEFLTRQRTEHERAHPARTPLARLRRRIVASVLPLDQALPRAIAAAYETPVVPGAAEPVPE